MAEKQVAKCTIDWQQQPRYLANQLREVRWMMCVPGRWCGDAGMQARQKRGLRWGGSAGWSPALTNPSCK